MARFFTTAPTTRAAVVQRQQTLDAYSIVPMQLSAIHRTVLKMTQSRPPTMPTNARGGLVHSRGGTSDQGHASRGGCTYSANTMNGIWGTSMKATEAYITDVDVNTVVVA